MGSFDFRGAQADLQRVYFDLAYWFEACAPTDAPFLPDAPCVRVINVSRPDRHMLPALVSDSPLAWVDAALHAVAVLRGPVVADRLARAVRAAGMAGIEGYGLAWRSTALSSDGVARFEIQPVVATLATLGLGAASETADGLPLWRLITKRRADLGLEEADAAGIRLAPPTRPLAAFSLQSAGAASPQTLTRLRRVAHRAIERLRARHGAALARMPLYLGLDGRPGSVSGEPAPGATADDPTDPDLAAAARTDADWERMYGHWLRWQAEHPHRRPPPGSSLARWLDAQHAAVRDGRLTRRRTELLDESGLPLATG